MKLAQNHWWHNEPSNPDLSAILYFLYLFYVYSISTCHVVHYSFHLTSYENLSLIDFSCWSKNSFPSQPFLMKVLLKVPYKRCFETKRASPLVSKEAVATLLTPELCFLCSDTYYQKWMPFTCCSPHFAHYWIQDCVIPVWQTKSDLEP